MVCVNTNAAGTNGLGDVELRKVVRGKKAALCSDTYTLPQSWPVTVKVKVTSGDEATVRIDGTP